MLFKEDHPIALNLSFSISLGLLPVTMSLKTSGCGIKNSGLSAQEDDDAENNRKNSLSKSLVFGRSSFHIFRFC